MRAARLRDNMNLRWPDYAGLLHRLLQLRTGQSCSRLRQLLRFAQGQYFVRTVAVSKDPGIINACLVTQWPCLVEACAPFGIITNRLLYYEHWHLLTSCCPTLHFALPSRANPTASNRI